MIETTLGDVLNDISRFSWKDCVYITTGAIEPSTLCLVINDNDAELGTDDFTPLEAERRNMEEFLSIHDLQSVIQNLQHYTSDASIELKCAAAVYYFKHDAFMPEGHQI